MRSTIKDSLDNLLFNGVFFVIAAGICLLALSGVHFYKETIPTDWRFEIIYVLNSIPMIIFGFAGIISIIEYRKKGEKAMAKRRRKNGHA